MYLKVIVERNPGSKQINNWESTVSVPVIINSIIIIVINIIVNNDK